MTVDEMIAACTRTNPLTGKAVDHVALVTTWPTPPSGNTVRLLRTQGPSGRLCNVKEREDGGYDVVAYYKTSALLKMLKAAQRIEQA